MTNQIGEAWYGRHVVIITCNPITDIVLKVDHSAAAPLEPHTKTCSETIGTYFSIGYKLAAVTPVSPYFIQYVFMK
jgi:hypothetical protein